MAWNSIWENVEHWPLAVAIQDSPLLFPVLETVHVMALALVVGLIARVDLRLLGLRDVRTPVARLAADLLPWIWGAFAVAAKSGGLMFMSLAKTYANNLPFQLKIAVLVLAGINMLAFHRFTFPRIDEWDRGDRSPPWAARLAGGLSLYFWISIVFLGRWIGFTT